MLDEAELINEYLKIHPYEAEENLIEVYDTIKKVKYKPTKDIAEAYYNMVFNDTFGSGEYIQKIKWKEIVFAHYNIKWLGKVLKIKRKVRRLLGRNN